MKKGYGKHGRVAAGCLMMFLSALALLGGGCATLPAKGLLDNMKTYNSRGEHGKAVESATRLIKLLEGDTRGTSDVSTAAAYFWRGYSYDLWKDKLNRGRHVSPDTGRYRDAALADYKAALEKNPEFVEACFNTALIYYDEGRFDEALKYFKKTTAISPATTEAHAYIAEIYYRTGCYEEAAKAIEGLIIEGAAESLEEARRLESEGHDDEAIAVLEEAVRLYPDFAEAYGELGMLHLFRKKNMMRALYYLNKYSAMIQDEEKKRGIEKLLKKIEEYCKPSNLNH